MAKHYGRALATLAELAEFTLQAIDSLADAARGRSSGRLRPRLQAPLLSMPARFSDER
jgi:hypothetical protein